MSDTARIVLVRHGQSRATVDGVAGGDTGCKGLTELGSRQAATLAARVAATGEMAGASRLVASTLPRAVETADALVPVLGLPVETDREFCEMDPGEGDGLTWAEWDRRYGGFNLTAQPFRPLAPGGESWAAFGLRVGTALARLATASAGQTVVVACHGGVIEQSILSGLHMAGRPIETVPNTSITEWIVDLAPAGGQQWRLIRFGDAAHLDPSGEPRPIRWS